jgi:hypothetical protein
MVEAMLVLPDRGTPFNTMMRPASVTPTSQRTSSINTTADEMSRGGYLEDA